MAVVYQRPHALLDVPTHYCPGCTHGVIHKLVAQAIDELGCEGRTIGIAPVGCSVMAYNYFGCDMIELRMGARLRLRQGSSAPCRTASYSLTRRRRPGGHRHRRNGPLCNTRRKYYSYLCQQRHLRHDRRPDGPDYPAGPGDADNADRTRRRLRGFPGARVRDALDAFRRCVCRARGGRQRAEYPQAAAAIKKAFTCQIEKKGFSIVEILSTCPTNWGLTPVEALQWLRDNMMPYYPLGVYADKTEKGVRG